MNSKYHNYTTDVLKTALTKINVKIAEGVIAASEILLELARRGERHPYMRGGLFRWYEPLANRTLSAHAAIAFGGVGTIIRKLVGMDLLQQQELANGGKVVVAEHDATGKIIRVEKPILQLTTRQLDLAFDNGAFVPFETQRKTLGKRQPDVRRSSVPLEIRADMETGEVVCGQMRFTPLSLVPALKKLGFKIEKIT